MNTVITDNLDSIQRRIHIARALLGRDEFEMAQWHIQKTVEAHTFVTNVYASSMSMQQLTQCLNIGRQCIDIQLYLNKQSGVK